MSFALDAYFERIRLAEPPARWVVLVLPDFGVSTKDAFAWFDRDRPAPQEHELVNDLEAPVAARHPEIARIIAALRRSGASHAAMSGSGSAVFGLFSGRETAVEAARRLKASSRRALVTRTLNHQRYQALAAT